MAALATFAAGCVPADEEPGGPDAGDTSGPDSGQPAPRRAPELGTLDHSPDSVVLTPIATFADGLRNPRDLAFNPRRPDELWIVSNDDDGVVIVSGASTAERTAEHRIDGYAMHFMDSPSSLAFGADATTIGKPGTFATCSESRNTYNGQAPPNDFMGPALWSSDLTVFALQDPIGLGSHLDMLHGSPDCMGVAHERDNVYWAFGGKKQSGATAQERNSPAPAIVRYDFGLDHGVGMDDHQDGTMRQYVTGQVQRVPGVPSHLVFDPRSALLYVADTGNARIAALDTTSGTPGATMTGMEPVAEYRMMDGATLADVVPLSSGLLGAPSGIELRGDLLYVSDNATGWISAFTLQGERVNYLDTGLGHDALAGMAFGPDGKLYVVDMKGDRVLRIDPKQ